MREWLLWSAAARGDRRDRQDAVSMLVAIAPCCRFGLATRECRPRIGTRMREWLLWSATGLKNRHHTGPFVHDKFTFQRDNEISDHSPAHP